MAFDRNSSKGGGFPLIDRKISIAVCEDESAQAEYISSLVRGWIKKTGIAAELISFASAESLLFHYDDRKDADILLLDIQMGAMNGVELAKIFRKENDAVQIVFITGLPDFMAEGFEVSALHYLLKPVAEAKLHEVLDRALGRLRICERFVTLTAQGGKTRLPVSEILYAEAFSHNVTIYTPARDIGLYESLSAVEAMLGDGFIRCHRSYIVNIRRVAQVNRSELVLDDKKATRLPLSRSYYNAVNEAFIKFN